MAATAGNSGNQLAAPMDSAQADMRSWLLSSAKILPKRVDKLLAVLDDEEVDTFDHLRVFAGKIGGACDKLLTETTVGMIRAALACDAGALQVPPASNGHVRVHWSRRDAGRRGNRAAACPAQAGHTTAYFVQPKAARPYDWRGTGLCRDAPAGRNAPLPRNRSDTRECGLTLKRVLKQYD